MKLHRPGPPPEFSFDDATPFVMHYAPSGAVGGGPIRCLGVRACDGGPMADLDGAAGAVRLFQEKEIYVAPRWASANVPHAVTCKACTKTEAFRAASSREAPPEPVDEAVEAAMPNRSLGSPTAT